MTQAQIAARAALTAAQSRLATFLARSSFDPQDVLARRSIRAIEKTRAMRKNAFDRGDEHGFARSHDAYGCALQGFACINVEKDYDFAIALGDDAVALTEATRDIRNPGRFTVAQIEQAEIVIDRLGGKLTPVATVSGLTGVAILRGLHCSAAMEGVVVANDR
jgi:hypothetical protein